VSLSDVIALAGNGGAILISVYLVVKVRSIDRQVEALWRKLDVLPCLYPHCPEKKS